MTVWFWIRAQRAARRGHIPPTGTDRKTGRKGKIEWDKLIGQIGQKRKRRFRINVAYQRQRG